jgi:hypothetical protein
VVLSLDDETATTATTTHAPTAQLGDPLQERTQPTRESGKPDESAVAAAISQAGSRSYPTLNDSFQSQAEQPKSSAVSAPDEAKIAASLAEHSDVGPQARARAWQEKLDSMTPQERDEAFVKGH